MVKDKKLIIIGIGETADIAYEYFTYDSGYEVVAFSVNKNYMPPEKSHQCLPVVPFENIENEFSPSSVEVYVAISYTHLNRDRTKMYNLCKKKGYTCASYISSRCFVWHNVEIGENTFIFEDNTIQYCAKIGNNVTLWSGNHVGHQTVIEDNVWVTSHCVISGFCKIGKNSFIGVNATIGDNVELGEDSVFGAGAVTVHSLPEKGHVYVGNPVKMLARTAYEQFCD